MLNDKIKQLDNLIKKISGEIERSQPHDIVKNIVVKDLYEILNPYLVIFWTDISSEEGINEENLKLAAYHGLSEQGIQKFQKDSPAADKLLKALTDRLPIIEDISSIKNISLQTLLANEGVFAVAELPLFRSDSKICGILEIYLKNKENFEDYKILLHSTRAILTTLCAVFYAKLSNDPEIKQLNQEKGAAILEYQKQIKSFEDQMIDLKRLQNLAIDRELQMVKLKEQLKQLRGER